MKVSRIIAVAIKGVSFLLVKAGIPVVFKGDWRYVWESRGEEVNLSGVASLADGRPPDDTARTCSFVARSIDALDLIREGTAWLDVGVGSGLLHRAIMDLAGGNDLSVGCDYSLPSLRISARNAGGISLVNCLADLLPFREHSFDFVLFYSVTHYLSGYSQLKMVITEFARLLKPGGHIFLGDIPDRDHLTFNSYNPRWFIPSVDRIRPLCAKAGLALQVTEQAPDIATSSQRVNLLLRLV